jgi:hypothetical protein
MRTRPSTDCDPQAECDVKGTKLEEAEADPDSDSSASMCKAPFDEADVVHVSHECFGVAKGTLFKDKYTSPNAKCIQCKQCSKSIPHIAS